MADRRGGVAIAVILCLIVVATIAGAVYMTGGKGDSSVDTGEMVTHVASRGQFEQVLIERGQIESSNQVDIVCHVKTRWFDGLEILWVADEGTPVKAGDLVVELDSSKLQERFKEEKIDVLEKESTVENNRAILEQAKISRREYLDGTFKNEESTLLMELAVSEEDLRKASQALQSSQRLLAKGLITRLQLEADQNAVKNAENARDTANKKLEVLRSLTRQKMLVQFDTDIEAAQTALLSSERSLAMNRRWKASIGDQIKKCKMYAPSDGVVIHANEFSTRSGRTEFVVEPGAEVRQQQTIVRLPDPNKMQVVCKVNESRVTLLEPGMLVKIEVDALPQLSLMGKVTKVNMYAEPANYMSTSAIKKYATYIEIHNPPAELRTGMTAEAQILVQQFENAIQIPLEGIYEHGGEMYSMIRREDGSYETVAVDIAATNKAFASIGQGLAENDQVVLNLRDYLELMELPELLRTDTSEFKAIAAIPSADEEGVGGVDGRPIATFDELPTEESDG